MVIQQFLRETIMSAVFLTIQLVILLTKYYNNWLVLCFGYLIRQCEDFKKFISVLSNLYLFLKNSSSKQAVFRHQEWKAYDLLSLTLIKETRAQSKQLGQRPIFLLKGTPQISPNPIHTHYWKFCIKIMPCIAFIKEGRIWNTCNVFVWIRVWQLWHVG